MSLASVTTKWPVYRDVVCVMFAVVNGKFDPTVIVPFPADDPTEWSDWSLAAFAHIDAAADLVLTDAALRQIVTLLAACESLAAKIVLAAPQQADVDAVGDALKEINKRVKADGRFHAALAIGVALAAEIAKERAS